jgi:hypothetical protein
MYGVDPPMPLVAKRLGVNLIQAKAMWDSLTKIEAKTPSLPLTKAPILIIRIIMGVVGSGASAMSCYYTTIWLLEFLPSFLAFFLSFLMIIFSVLAFQVVFVIHQSHTKWQWVLIPVFSVLWITVVFFSMGSTVAGQYNVRYEKTVQEITDTSSVPTDIILIDMAEDDIVTIEDELTARKRDRDSMLESLEKINALSVEERLARQDEYNQIWNRMNAINGRINQLVMDLDAARTRYRKEIVQRGASIVTNQVQEERNFYTWLSSIFGIDAEQVQFWSSIFPAIFIDLIAPIGIAVAFFLHIQTNQTHIRHNKK